MNWNKSSKGRFNAQKNGAKERNIDFLLSFEEWWGIWQDSGMWESRGRGLGKACMSRLNDKGPYSIGNVKIQLQSENQREYLTRRWDSFTRVDRSHLPAAEQAWYVPGWKWDPEFNLIKA